ncbi:hypothetical protein [Halodurantibacterium flavum]|uniref:CopL family metal-binding regulatory protein n=1 Tax=Halodurantibacterium flavum TaxID=1382802 RepID=A0ABW4S3K4_9RHOB
MKKSARICNMAMAAVLALAFAFIWPPASFGSPLSYDHAAQAEAHTHQAHAKRGDQHSLLTVQMEADCDAAAAGCCMMAHCCPGISVGAHEITTVTASDETTAATPVPGLGSDPGVILPPPRRL